MKVIDQLIDYLKTKEALSDDDIQFLIDHGFYKYADEEPEIEEDDGNIDRYDDNYAEELTKVELIEEEFSSDIEIETIVLKKNTGGKKKSRGGGRKHTHDLSLAEINSRIMKCIPLWAEKLQGIEVFAEECLKAYHPSRYVYNYNYPVNILNSPEAIIWYANDRNYNKKYPFTTLLLKSLKLKKPSLQTLWNSLTIDDYRNVLKGWKGQNVSLYNKIISAGAGLNVRNNLIIPDAPVIMDDYKNFNLNRLNGRKYDIAFKYPCISFVYHLVRVQLMIRSILAWEMQNSKRFKILSGKNYKL